MPDAISIAFAVIVTLAAVTAIALACWHSGTRAWREYRAKKRREACAGYLLDRPRLGIDPNRRRGS